MENLIQIKSGDQPQHDWSVLSDSVRSEEHTNSQRLIEFVEANPCIWNKENDGYLDKTKKDKAWVSICTELDPAFVKLSKKKQHETRQQITKRWSNIRDAYRKYLKSRGQKRPYLYASFLTFLDPNYNTVKKEVNEGTDDDEEKEKCEVTWLEDNYVDDAEFNGNKTLPETNHLEKGCTNENIAAVLLDMIQKEDDGDRLFLKSLLPLVKSLKDETKIEFKIQVMKLLKVLNVRDKQRTLKRKASDVEWMGNGFEPQDSN